ncbi:protein phosphatase 1 regulatory subunit 37 [Stigmatopora nigra]
MNIEEQRLDLCNVKTKTGLDDGHPNNTFGISELIADPDVDERTVVAAGTMPHLADGRQLIDGDNQQVKDALEIDEVNGNKQDGGSPIPGDSFFPVDGDCQDNGALDKTEDSEPVTFNDPTDEDGGEMDMGVDLSLDESGVLEGDTTTTVPSPSDGVVSQPSGESVQADGEAESQSDPLQTSQPSGTDHAVLYPTVEEGDDQHKLGGKRVTFPSDDDIVSGAVEPKDPWRHAQNVTVDDILSSYKQACQKLNCKPISKVLKQIQELEDLTQRNECLDLKGEKLDYKTCESLEEILKRVQFKVIDLEQTNLDEDGASALFDMIEYYESATHLNISFNKHIGTRGWQAAAHMMRKTSSLQYLDARNTPLLDHSAPFVARALRISGSLAVLHLESAGLSGRPLMLLATALKMNMNLRELYLADNKLNGLQDSAQLGNLLKFNYNIQILDLRNNHILDSGLAYVCEGLKEQRKGLVTLVLWNNQLTHNGMGYLAAALPCTQSLETLNLGHNSVGNEGVHKLKDGLIANRSVLRLGLASTKLSCEGAVAVAEFIAESPRLLRLDLRENEIKTGGLMALSLALKVNTSLLRLDLDREPKKETVKSFIETQRALLAEIQNGCKRNFILAKEKEETEQMMRQSASMAEIATEDGNVEEDVGASDDGGPADKDKETTTSQEQPDREPEATISPMNLDSDSDTDDEEELVTKAPSEPSPSLTEAAPPASSPSPTPRAVISEISVTDNPIPPGTPPSPGRCISVSSPGRGHKIFMVTRVESPPEPQIGTGPVQNAQSATPKQTPETGSDDTLRPPSTGQQSPASPSSLATLQPTDPSLPDAGEPEAISPVTKNPDEDAKEEIQTLERLQDTEDDPERPESDGQEAEPPVSPEQLSMVCTEPAQMDESQREVTDSLLPNGLKAEFSLHLLESDSPKAGSCVMEHVSVSCTQDLEELLLEASLETGREAS